jgi:hypothetical protein
MPPVNYQLSFENYLEMNASRREVPSYRAALIAALLGLALILGGYFYLRIPPPDEWSYVGGILLASGLLSEFVAMILGLMARPKSSKPSLKTLRREYGLYATDERAVEFDEKGWRVRWYEGDDVRPWTSLRAVHDLKSLVVLSTIGTHYWLPKAALEVDGNLAQIKSLATSTLESRGILFTVPIKPSAVTWVLANLIHSWRRNLRANLLVATALGLVLYWVLLADWTPFSAHPHWLLVLVPVFSLACESLYFLQGYYSAKWGEAAQEARIMEDCIGYKTATINWIHEFRTLIEWREIPGTFMLYFQSNQFHFVPKKRLSISQIEQFRILLVTQSPRS